MPHKNIEDLCDLNVYEDELCRPLTGQQPGHVQFWSGSSSISS